MTFTGGVSPDPASDTCLRAGDVLTIYGICAPGTGGAVDADYLGTCPSGSSTNDPFCTTAER